MSLGQHLEELRKRVIYCVIAVVGASAVSWGFRDQVMAAVEWPQVISFTISMYDHKFPVTIPFDFKDRRLFAVVLHKGWEEGGHYAALIRVRDKWYIKEDATVYELPCGIETMRGEFYMAFYRPDKLLA